MSYQNIIYPPDYDEEPRQTIIYKGRLTAKYKIMIIELMKSVLFKNYTYTALPVRF